MCAAVLFLPRCGHGMVGFSTLLDSMQLTCFYSLAGEQVGKNTQPEPHMTHMCSFLIGSM